MSFHNWEPALAALRVTLGPPQPELVALAKRLDIEYDKTWPSLVVAAAVRDCVDPVLHDSGVEAPTEAQKQYLSSLISETGMVADTPRTLREASAWIDFLLGTRAATALAHMKPNRGDVVDKVSSRDGRPGSRHVVSSISSRAVYFRGGNGYCGWVTSLNMVARAGTAEAAEAVAADPYQARWVH